MPQKIVVRTRLLAVATAATAALLGAGLSPAHGAAAAPHSGPSTPAVGDFSLGDALEAMIGEQDGSLAITVPVGGLELTWDSRTAHAADRFGFGAGWGPRLGFLTTEGAVSFIAASGEVYELDASAPSGLRGYTLGDVKLAPVTDADALPERTDGTLERRPEPAYVLDELGGQRTYFDRAGNPVTRLSGHGDRFDWQWGVDDEHRLERVVNPDGVVTVLDWTSERDVVIVRPGANLAPEADGAERDWRIELARKTIGAVVDPTGGRTEFAYARSHGGASPLVRVAGAAGATTEIGWQSFDDGVPRVERVRTVNGAGEELSSRTWSRVGASLPTGWPAVEPGSDNGYAAAGPYETAVSDGVTTVTSEYTAQHLLAARELEVAGASGERLMQRQELAYPKSAGDRGARAIGSVASRPQQATITRFDETGGERTAAAEFEYDALGRTVREVAEDGTIIATTYDDAVPAGAALPIGLAVEVTTTAPDGLVRTVHSGLDDTHRSVIARETIVSGGPAAFAPTVTERTEFTVEPDGFVSERRAFPSGDAAAEPVVTRWSATTDLPAGTMTTVETSAVGTDAETSTSETVSLTHGGVLRTTDVFGHAATTEYDALGRVTAVTGVDDRVTRTRYEVAQQHGRNATIVTGPDRVVETEIRDELGHVVRRTDNVDHGVAVDGHVRVIETQDHTVPGTVTVTDAWGATSSVSQDVFGRQVRAVDPRGVVHLTEHDDVAERVVTGASPSGRLEDAQWRETRAYDRASRTTATTIDRADGIAVPRTTETVDGSGLVTSATDGWLGTTAAYDAHGRPVTTTSTRQAPGTEHAPAGASASSPDPALIAERRFDDFGNPVEKQLIDGTGTVSGGTRVVDALGRTRSETDRSGRTSHFEYSADGLVTRAELSTGQETRSTYDPKTRALTAQVTTSPIGETVETAYEYDPVTGSLVAVFDPRDRAGTEIGYVNDAHGNLLSVTYPGDLQLSHTYDANGRRETTTDPAGLVTSFEYDTAGALVAAVQRDDDGGEVARVGYVFDELGRMVRLDRGNGVATEITYTSADEIAAEMTRLGDRLVSERRYEYDSRSLLVERVDRTSGGDAAGGGGDGDGDAEVTTTRYEYDARERLVASSVHDGEAADAPAIVATTYELSVGGDVISETVTGAADGGAAHTRRFDYAAGGELLAIDDGEKLAEQTYDAAGNLVRAADGTATAYDALNRPVTETTADGRTTEVRYWADGTRRARATVGADGIAQETEFIWDGAALAAELHEHGDEAASASYLLGASRHARVVSTGEEATAAYYGTDRHGNVTELLGASGEVSERYAYADYGKQVARGAGGVAWGDGRDEARVDARLDAAHVNPIRYAGEYVDDTGRQHLAVRSYDLATMRFTSPDTAPVMGPYGYADANPIMRIDPTGNTSEEDKDRYGTYVAMTFSALGLVGTVFSLLFPVAGAPLSTLSIVGLSIAGAADVTSLVTGSIRLAKPSWLDQETDSSLEEADALAGASVVGIGFALSNLWKRATRWLSARKARMRGVEEAPLIRNSSHGSDGGSRPESRPESTRSAYDEYEDIDFNRSPGGSEPDLTKVSSQYREPANLPLGKGIYPPSYGGGAQPPSVSARSAGLPAAKASTRGNLQESHRIMITPRKTPGQTRSTPSTGGATTGPASKASDPPVIHYSRVGNLQSHSMRRSPFVSKGVRPSATAPSQPFNPTATNGSRYR